jgi:putative ABC transport system permease protein
LGISNGFVAISGSIISEYQGFVDISMGTGLVITSLAAIIIGETVLRPEKVSSLLFAPVLGMLIYQIIVAVALQMGLAASDLKIATACLALIFVGLDRFRAHSGVLSRQIGNRNF